MCPVVESMQTPTPPIKGEVSLSYCVERPRVEVVVVVVVVKVTYESAVDKFVFTERLTD